MVRFWRMAVVLGLITAVGPFAIDMYLPALPTIGGTLRASPSAVQLSMTVFFITIGLCQMIYGPLSDIIGRKTPIYIGLLLFVIGSIGCALAPSIEVLVGFRIIQALGACAGMVIPRAIVRDLHTGPDAAQLMSLLMLVVSISPMLAPLSGSAVLSGFGWRGIFWVLAVAAVVSFLIALLQLKETLPADQRAGNSWGGALGFYRKLIVDPAFVGLAFAGGCGLSTFFVFIGSAAFVYINHFGLSQTQFSLLFALNAIGFFGFSQLTGVLGKRFGLVAVVRIAVAGFAAATIVNAALIIAGVESLPLIVICLFVGNAFLGLVLPMTAVLSLEPHGAIAGTASALLGSIQMITGAVFMGVAGLFSSGAPGPMLIGIALCAITAFITAQVVLRPGAAYASIR
jgi:DHA1 family bicyclomycin/chloramphenicol resistance-like MFS transporter